MEKTLRLLVGAETKQQISELIELIQSTVPNTSWEKFDSLEGLHAALSQAPADLIFITTHLSSCLTEIIEALHKDDPNTPLLVVDEVQNDTLMIKSMRAGARDYLSLDQPLRLVLAVEREISASRALPVISEGTSSREIHDDYFLTLIDFVSDAVAILNRDGTIRYETPSVERITGYSPKELIGHDVVDFLHPEDRPGAVEAFNRCLQSANNVTKMTFRIGHKHGGWRYLEARMYNLMHDSHVEGVVINYWDSTDLLSAVQAGRQAEAALKSSEEQYKALVEQQSDGIFISDSDGKIVDVNSSACRLLGYSRADLLGLTRSDLLAQDELDSILGHKESLKAGQTIVMEHNLQRSDGNSIPVELSIKMLTDGRVQGIVRDIRIRRQTEEVLRDIAVAVSGATGKAFFRSLVLHLARTLDMGYVFVGELSDKRNSILKTTAVCSGREIVDNFSYDLRFAPCSTLEQSEICCFPAEVGLLFPDDQLVSELGIESYIAMPLLDAEGRPLGMLAIMDRKPLAQTAIAEAMLQIFATRASAELERKRTEEQLGASEEKYRSLFEESRDLVFISTPEGRFLDVNPAGVKLLGYDSKLELLNVDIAQDLYSNREDRNVISRALIQQGYIKDYEIHLKKKNGQRITVLETAVAVKDEQGEVTSFRGTLRDVTEKKKLEQQLFRALKLEAIGTLAGGIAHDFNNVLAVILAYSELSRDDLLDDHPVQFYLQQIVNTVQRARDLIQQILTFSSQVEHERKPVHLHVIVEETLKLLRASIPSYIEIRHQIDKNNFGTMVDPVQIQRVIMNLCTNAYQAMQEHGGIMEVVLDSVQLTDDGVENEQMLPPGRYQRLTVKDTGEGMDKNTVQRIFDPFFTTKPIGEGSGMGLAVAHGIVKSHGGAIMVHSRPGIGSTFEVYVPHYSADVTASDDAIEQAPRGSEHILFVDDDKQLAGVKKEVLGRLGYQVTLIHSSLEALELVREDPRRFDLVITDQAMPRLPGVKMAEAMLEICEDLPIILLTGFKDLITAEKAKKAGIKEFIVKPVLSGELGMTIRRVLEKANADISNAEGRLVSDN